MADDFGLGRDFESLRQGRILTDGILVAEADGTEVEIHLIILAARSRFFLTLLPRLRQEQPGQKLRVEFSCPTTPVQGETVETVVNYVYTGDAGLTDRTVEAVFLVADYWIIPGLSQLCCDYYSNRLDPSNCLGVWRLADTFFQPQLSTKARRFALRRMSDCADSEEFQQLTTAELFSFLSDDWLNLPSEAKVSDLVCRWVGISKQRRSEVAKLLLSTARIDLDREQSRGELSLQNLLFRPRIPHDILFTVGGWSRDNPTNCVETYDYKANSWVEMPKLEDVKPRAYHGLVALNGFIYTIGGFDGSDYFNSVRRCNLQTAEWSEVAPMYSARCYVSAVALDGFLYAIGGFNGFDRLETAERYDPATNQWTLLGSMNRRRSDAAVAVLNGNIYIVGGFDGQNVLNSMEVYCPSRDNWTLVASRLNSPRSGLSLVPLDGTLLAVGGFDSRIRLKSVEKLNILTDQWAPVASMRSRRSNFGAAVLNGVLHVMGGYNGEVTVARAERYDPVKNRWERCARLNFHRSALKACVVENLPNAKDFSFHSIHTASLNP